MSLRRIEALRERLGELDDQLVELLARRLELASEIGRAKARELRQVRDYEQEGAVVDRVCRAAAERGIPESLAVDVVERLIQSSLRVQEQDRVALTGAGRGRSALVIGGAGGMGSWFVRFLLSQGFAVDIADPRPPAAPLREGRTVTDWRTLDIDHDFVVVAAPLLPSAEILHDLAAAQPAGVVFDVASLKSPVRAGLEALAAAGTAVTSVHPMFGPDAELLCGRHVVFCDVGHERAKDAARTLFEPTLAELVDMDLAEHDWRMASVLGLSHAVNLVFLDALEQLGADVEGDADARARSGVADLARISSTTFAAQLDVARRVAAENPHLYFEIQHLNEFGDHPWEALESAVQRLRSAVRSGDEADFVDVMSSGHRLVADLEPPPPGPSA